MPSANLVDAVATAVKARTVNSGQSCIAAKRFIVHEKIYEEFEQRFVETMRWLNVGDPLDPATDIGPLATVKILNELDEQVQQAVAAGARALTGGQRLHRAGNFYEPTVLAGVPRNCPVYYQELFAPVAMLFRAGSIDAAIEMANDSEFGLAASVWTQDDHERVRFIDEIEAGQIFVNRIVPSTPPLPLRGLNPPAYHRQLR